MPRRNRQRRLNRRANRRNLYSSSQPAANGIGKYAQYASTAAQALSLASHVYGIVNAEQKHYDELNNMNPDSATGASVSIIRGMTQGDTNVSLNGNSILCKQLVFGVSVNMNAVATSTKWRLMAVWDTRPSTTLATIPAWTDVQSASNVNSFMNIDDQLNRFRVIFDRRGTVTTSYPERQFTIYRKCFKHTKFTDAQVPNLNDIIILCFSDEAANTPTISVRSRLRYYDN